MFRLTFFCLLLGTHSGLTADLGPPLGSLSNGMASKARQPGDAAWFYDYKIAKDEATKTAQWVPELTWFNTPPVKNPISTVFSYGGDYEKYKEMQVYYPTESQQAARAYKNVTGVERIIVVTDGRMDGTESWAPDLSKLTPLELDRLGDAVATVFCSFPHVDGIQVDLEPYSHKYAAAVNHFLNRTSAQLRSTDLGCVDADHPYGRSLTYFCFGQAVTLELMHALGPNGFVTVSGYDLSSKPAGTPNPLPHYESELTATLTYLLHDSFPTWEKQLGWKPYAMVGIPAAASDHEFTRYTSAAGVVTEGAVPNYASGKPNYLESAINILQQHNSTYLLGKAYWAFTHFGGNGKAEPAHPFVLPGEGAFMKKN